MVTVALRFNCIENEFPCRIRREVEGVIGKLKTELLFRRGTDPEWFAEYRDRADADLAVVNLNLLPNVKARICGE